MKIMILLFTALLPEFIIANIPEIVLSKSTQLTLYTDSKETEKMGYNNCNMFSNGEYLIMKSFIQEGDFVLDVGAHVGEWSRLALSHTHNRCTLYSFEPVPQFFKELMSQLENDAQCFNIALGYCETEVVMNCYYGQYKGCSSFFERHVLSFLPIKKIRVPVTYLDKVCEDNNIDYIHFMKIDTEGSEWSVLQGGHNMITHKKINIIQFEYGGTYPDANITLLQIYVYLTSAGYSIFRITQDGLIYVPQWRKELENFEYSNYLAILDDT